MYLKLEKIYHHSETTNHDQTGTSLNSFIEKRLLLGNCNTNWAVQSTQSIRYDTLRYCVFNVQQKADV